MSDLQFLNAYLPILDTEQCIVISFNDSQPSDAESPIDVTNEGMLIFSNELHLSNAELQILTTFNYFYCSRNGNFFNDLQFLKISFGSESFVKDNGRSISVSDEHDIKASSPIFCTEYGIFNLRYEPNAVTPIIITESGIKTQVRLMHELKV